MQTKDLVLNNGSEREVIKEFSKYFPNLGVAILAQTFIIKSIPRHAQHVRHYTY